VYQLYNSREMSPVRSFSLSSHAIAISLSQKKLDEDGRTTEGRH